MTVNLRTLQADLVQAGKNYVGLDAPAGPVQTTTTGLFSRWRARHPDAGAQQRNRDTIDAFVTKLRGVEGYGNALADLVQGRLAALRAAGQPLSGRRAAEILKQAENEARDAYVRTQSIGINIREGTGALATRHLGKLERMFGVAGGTFTGRRDAILAQAQATLAEQANRTGATPGRQDMEKAVMAAVLDSYLDHDVDIAAKIRETEVQTGRPYTPVGDRTAAMRREIREAVLANLPAEVNVASHDIDKSEVVGKICLNVVRRPYYHELTAVTGPVLSGAGPDTDLSRKVLSLVQERDPTVTVSGDVLKRLGERLRKSIEDSFLGRMPLVLPTAEEVKQVRDQKLAELFGRIGNYGQGTTLSETGKAAAKRALLGGLESLKPATYGAIAQVHGKADRLLALLATGARTPAAAGALNAFLTESLTLLGAFGEEIGADQLFPIFDVALTAALATLPPAEALALLETLAQPGSVFLESVQQLQGDDAFASPLGILMATLREKAEASESPALANAFTLPVDVAQLSLARQREILGPGVFVVGTGPLPMTEADLQGERNAWRQESTPLGEGLLRIEDNKRQIPFAPGPRNPNDPGWVVTKQFGKDVGRTPVFVNGTPVRTGDDFIQQLPDRRTASILSRMMNQFLSHLPLESAPPATRELLLGLRIQYPALSAESHYPTTQQPSVTAVGDGTYRLRFEMTYTYNGEPFTEAKAPPPLKQFGYSVEYLVDPRNEPPTVLDTAVDLVAHTF